MATSSSNNLMLVVFTCLFVSIIGYSYHTAVQEELPATLSAEQVAIEKQAVQRDLTAVRQRTAAYPQTPPMMTRTALFAVKYSFADTRPYYFKYYLYTPTDYDPAKKYPLLLLLHGVTRFMHGGYYVTDPEIQRRHPSFVLVPIAPEGTRWDILKPSDMLNSAVPLAMTALQQVLDGYSIDRSRIYISGSSMGGSGTYAMIERYPDIFAGALVLCGSWPGAHASRFPANMPILAVHGSEDTPSAGRQIIDALRAQGKPASFKVYDGVGHDIWRHTYTDPAIWNILFSLKRSQ